MNSLVCSLEGQSFSVFISIYVAMSWGASRRSGSYSVAARGDKQGKMGRCLALCYALNCLGAARVNPETRDCLED